MKRYMVGLILAVLIAGSIPATAGPRLGFDGYGNTLRQTVRNNSSDIGHLYKVTAREKRRRQGLVARHRELRRELRDFVEQHADCDEGEWNMAEEGESEQ